LKNIILNIVTEKTGYEADMIDFNQNLEADLGVDSIKRIDISKDNNIKYSEISLSNQIAAILRYQFNWNSSDIKVKFLDKFNSYRNEIDFILFCTQSPDYFLPTTACVMQDRLGIPTTAGALDFNLGCSGYIYGLSLAKGLIETGTAKNVLLITAETYSKFIHPSDKGVRTIFGDAAAATLISVRDTEKDMIGPFVLGTDGKGAEKLMVKNGGMRHPYINNETAFGEDSVGNFKSSDHLYMKGSDIFVFTLVSVPKLCKDLLEKANTSYEDLDLVIFHQANKHMLEALRKKIDI
jgi:3-oxoacyl-[acyl-carrier-protein] synthase-3